VVPREPGLEPAFQRAAQKGDRYFRWRGGDVSRLEGLTDGVFALSATVLVVPFEGGGDGSLLELREILRRAPVVALCFAFLIMVWQYHQRFHRRYGLEDGVTLWLNGLFLFLLLMAVYPLKLLASLLVAGFAPLGGLSIAQPSQAEWQELMTVYGVLIGGLFLCLWGLTWRAHGLREALELNAVEVALTRSELRMLLAMVGFSALSIALTWTVGPSSGGLIYTGIGPVMGVLGWWGGRDVVRLRS
jgi:uncharacterized membrane protein